MSATRNVYADEPYEDLQAVRFTDGNRILCDVGYSGTIEGDTANARRIVACWNACLSIPTETLENYYGDQGGIDAAIDEASLRGQVKVMRDRDASRALLEEIHANNEAINNGLRELGMDGMSEPARSLADRIKTFLESK